MRRTILLLFVMLFAACSPVKKYRSLPEVLAWENDIRQFEHLDSAEIYQPDAVLFTGSSSIRRWSTLKQDMAPYPVIQRGFGGSKLSDFVVYAARIVSPHPCRAIVIFIANDITGGDKDKTPEEVASLFHTSLKIIRKTHKDTPVFWVAVTPTPSRWKAWSQVKKAGALIQAICSKEKNTFYIKTDSAFLDNGKPMEKYFVSDMLHLNPDGYRVWTSVIKKELNKVIPMPKPEIIGHRGASYIAPENTLSSANLAWELGADAVECDIHLSKDGKIMVSHDANTKRTTGEDHKISETQSSDLRKLDAGLFKDVKYRGEKIPFLEELIGTVPQGKELVIEIKSSPEILPELKRVINDHGKGKRFVFIAFDFNTISLAKKAFPDNSCYWLCSNAELLQKNINSAAKEKLDGLSLSYNIITDSVAKQAKSLGLELYTWTVDDPSEAKRLISLGVKGITTNRPGWLNERIGN